MQLSGNFDKLHPPDRVIFLGNWYHGVEYAHAACQSQKRAHCRVTICMISYMGRKDREADLYSLPSAKIHFLSQKGKSHLPVG